MQLVYMRTTRQHSVWISPSLVTLALGTPSDRHHERGHVRVLFFVRRLQLPRPVQTNERTTCFGFMNVSVSTHAVNATLRLECTFG